MPTDKLLVTMSGVFLSVFILWYFLGRSVRTVKGGKEIAMIVDGGYNPESIEIRNGAKTTLIFTRLDPSSCLEEVTIPDFKVRKFLPMNQAVHIEITPVKVGEYQISCGMNMFHGKIKVV